MDTTMHHEAALVITGAPIIPIIPAPRAEDDDACVMCGFWRCRCAELAADVAWEEAVADHVAADVELLAETRVELLAGYGELVLGARVDAAGLDALGDMLDEGLIRPEDLAVPTPAVQLLTAVTAWVGQDIQDEDDERGYEPEDLTVAPACAKGDPVCHCGSSVMAGSACGACGCSAGGPKQCDR